MAVEGPQPTKWSFPAGADLSAAANQYKFVEVDSSGNVTVCNAATDRPVGVLQNRPKSGEAAEVVIAGITKLQADAALTIGTLIGTSADGQADAKTLGDAGTEFVVGMALSASGAAAEIITALVDCSNPSKAS
jgi:hypothetical protein